MPVILENLPACRVGHRHDCRPINLNEDPEREREIETERHYGIFEKGKGKLVKRRKEEKKNKVRAGRGWGNERKRVLRKR